MYYDRVTKAEDVVRLASGMVQCGGGHRKPYSWREDLPRDPATEAWVDKAYGGLSLSFTCKRHSGTVKANVTKGSYSFLDVRNVSEYGITLAQAAADPAAIIATITQMQADEKAAHRALMEQQDLDLRRHFWDEKRAEYADGDDITFEPFEKPDEFGRVYVGIVVGGKAKHNTRVHISLTPGQLRKIIEFGEVWARNAENLTALEVKP